MLIKMDCLTIACDMHVQEFLDFSKITTFPFVHEEFLLLVNSCFVLTKEHGIVDIDNGNDDLLMVFADKETHIRQ